MNLTEKKYAALAEMQTGENISRICDRYYHNLKDKEVLQFSIHLYMQVLLMAAATQTKFSSSTMIPVL